MVVACFTAALACLGARAVDRATSGVLRDREGYMIVRVIAPEGEDGMNRAATALIGMTDIAQAQVMSAGRAAELLRTWAGAAVNQDDLPPLRLIEVTLADDAPASARSEREIVAGLADVGVTAEAIGPPADDGRVADAARLRSTSYLGAGALSAVMALIVLMAARSLAMRRRDLVTVLADLGAPRSDAGLKLSDEAGAAAFLAGAIGAAAAGAAGFFFAGFAFPDVPQSSVLTSLTAGDIAPLIAAPFAAAFAAGLGARLASEALYARASRFG
ncbi:MAG: hypothetical protein ABW199_00290 [Caulobacterales bacterium]